MSADLGKWLEPNGMAHSRGRPYHPMTQGKIERRQRSMQNQILRENHYLPSEFEARFAGSVAYYNTRRYHESLDNVTPEAVYFGRVQTILGRRHTIKRETLEQRRCLHTQAEA